MACQVTDLALVTTAEPERLELPERLSMSYLQDASRCLRMADLKRKADTSGEDATVGTIVHEVAALAGMRAARLGVDRLDADELERLAREVLRTPIDGVKPLSLDGWRTVIRLSRRLAHVYDEGPPPFPIGAEYEVYATRELGDRHTISSRIDKRWLDEREMVGWVVDYKTGGRMAADEITFQGRTYCWQWLGTRPDIRGFWFGEHALPYGGPGWVWIDAEDLDEFEDYLLDTVARMEVAYAEQKLLPSPGSWCDSMCPDRAGCPLPEFAKGDVRVGTDAEAVATLDRLIVQRARSRDATAALRDRLEATGATHIVSSSGDQEFGYTDGTRCQVRKARREEV